MIEIGPRLNRLIVLFAFLMEDAFIVSARLGDLLYALGRQKYGKD